MIPTIPSRKEHRVTKWKPAYNMATVVGSNNRSVKRRRIDQMKRSQKRHRHTVKIALIALADPHAPPEAKDGAHAVFVAHRNRVTAIERTHGRAIEREVTRDMRMKLRRNQINSAQ